MYIPFVIFWSDTWVFKGSLNQSKKGHSESPKKTRVNSPKTNMDTKNSLIVERKSSSKTSKNFPTDPWSIPQTPNQQFMFRNSCNIWGWKGMSGVCCTRGMAWGSLRKPSCLGSMLVFGSMHFHQVISLWKAPEISPKYMAVPPSCCFLPVAKIQTFWWAMEVLRRAYCSFVSQHDFQPVTFTV